MRALQRIGAKVRIARNQTIFRQGDAVTSAYKVVSGVVRVCKHLPGDRRQIARFCYPGDFFSLLDFEIHRFTAEAVTDVVLTSYPHTAIAALSEQRPTVRRRFLTVLSQNQRDMENHLAVLGRQNAKEKVVSFLLSLAERIGLDDDDLVDVPMNRLDIADYLGLTNETVSREISALKRAGFIETPNNRQLILCNADALQALTEGDDEAEAWNELPRAKLKLAA